jgi:hypothetical protein
VDLDPLPRGFRWTWVGGTVRVDLPRLEKTASHVYEPVLSERDAERLAQALALRDTKRMASGATRKLSRVLLAHDPAFSAEGLASFRMRLSVALIEYGLDATIDDLLTTSVIGPEYGASGDPL